MNARVLIGGIVLTLAAGTAALSGYAWNNATYAARDARKVLRAGYAERRVTLPSGTRLGYVEGPDAGPPVVLLHGQSSAWQSYNRVLPDLAADFHVFAPDLAGHGTSDRTPGAYTPEPITRDVVDFLREVVGTPVLLSGHSSGGLIAAAVAAAAPELVRGILFEDPPFFSTDPDRATSQFNYVDLSVPAHEFVHQNFQRPDSETDFASYYLAHNAWIHYFGDARDRVVRFGQRRRRRHPEQPLVLWFLPPALNEAFAHMHRFDPAFADAFYTLDFQRGLDQEATLARIDRPTTLVHANWRVTDDGILEGAMTDADAARAAGLLTCCRTVRVDTGHGFHFEDPAGFARLVRELGTRE